MSKMRNVDTKDMMCDNDQYLLLLDLLQSIGYIQTSYLTGKQGKVHEVSRRV